MDKQNDKAQRIVALGIGSVAPYDAGGTIFYRVPADGRINGKLTAEQFCNDWRVVGALMTMLRKKGYSFLLHSYPDGKALMTVQKPFDGRPQKKWAAQIVNDDDAIAIVDACLEALADDTNP